MEGAHGVPKASTPDNASEGSQQHCPFPQNLHAYHCNTIPTQSHPIPRIYLGSPRRLGHGPTPVWAGPAQFRRPEGDEGPLRTASGNRRRQCHLLIVRCCHADGDRWGLLAIHHGHGTGGPRVTEGSPGHLVRTRLPQCAGHEGYQRGAPGKVGVVGGVQSP